MLGNTAIAICLLADCASLVSYWLSQRKVLAGERPSLGWIGLAMGSALLLFAAIIALTTTWVDSIRLASTADLPQPAVGQPAITGADLTVRLPFVVPFATRSLLPDRSIVSLFSTTDFT